MLTAITEGKAGRISIPGSENSISWREVFRRSEDLLTAVFFGRLRFLSDESVRLVMALLIGQEAANNLGQFEETEFWPHLRGLQDRSWVEPDILLHFENATLIVEVKPPFGGAQYLEQWQAEVHSFVAECANGAREAPEVVHFVALGQNSCPSGSQPTAEFDTQDYFKLWVHAQEWESIVDALPGWRAECSRADAAVFEDWSNAFELFELYERKVPLTWSDLTVFNQAFPLSGDMLALLSRPGDGASPSDTAPAPEKISRPWQPLLAFARANPLELCTWN